MSSIFWIPIGAVALGVVGGSIIGSAARGGSAGTGALVGGFLALMVTFPLLAIGLASV